MQLSFKCLQVDVLKRITCAQLNGVVAAMLSGRFDTKRRVSQRHR